MAADNPTSSSRSTAGSRPSATPWAKRARSSTCRRRRPPAPLPTVSRLRNEVRPRPRDDSSRCPPDRPHARRRSICAGAASTLRSPTPARCGFTRAAIIARRPRAISDLSCADRRNHRRARCAHRSHRTWLNPASPGDDAPVSSPRPGRACALARGATAGLHSSSRMAMPDLPMIAALSANPALLARTPLCRVRSGPRRSRRHGAPKPTRPRGRDRSVRAPPSSRGRQRRSPASWPPRPPATSAISSSLGTPRVSSAWHEGRAPSRTAKPAEPAARDRVADRAAFAERPASPPFERASGRQANRAGKADGNCFPPAAARVLVARGGGHVCIARQNSFHPALLRSAPAALAALGGASPVSICTSW